MAKLSGVAVLLLVVVPLSMYTCALPVGIQLGRALERGPEDNSGSSSVEFTWRGALDYVTKELWDISILGRRGGGRRQNHHVWVSAELVPVDVASRRNGSVEMSSSSEEPYVALLDLASADNVQKTIATPSTKRRYYNYTHTSPTGVISVGPWGGSGGHLFYMGGASAPRLRSIVVYHSGAIHSLYCEYTLAGDYEGLLSRVAGPWGHGSGGVCAQIDLRSGEHVTAVEGTTGHFANVPSVVITSLTFRTSAGRTYGPYGSGAASGSRHFSVPAADGACIAGFWGRSGWLLDAIGVYMKSSCSSSSSPSDTAAYEKYYASIRQGRSNYYSTVNTPHHDRHHGTMNHPEQQQAAEIEKEVTLLGFWASPYVVQVKWALAMKGVEYEYVEEDLQSKSAQLLAYNPVHKKVPVLVYQGRPIAESQVILEFVDDAWSHRGDPILPRDPYQRAAARSWARFQQDKLSPPIWRWFTTDGEEQEAAYEAAVEQLLVLEKELAVAGGKPFFGGEKVGFVDLTLGPLAYVVPMYEEIIGGVKLVAEEKMPSLAAWMRRFLGSPAVIGHLPPLQKLRPRYQAVRQAFLSQQEQNLSSSSSSSSR